MPQSHGPTDRRHTNVGAATPFVSCGNDAAVAEPITPRRMPFGVRLTQAASENDDGATVTQGKGKNDVQDVLAAADAAVTGSQIEPPTPELGAQVCIDGFPMFFDAPMVSVYLRQVFQHDAELDVCEMSFEIVYNVTARGTPWLSVSDNHVTTKGPPWLSVSAIVHVRDAIVAARIVAEIHTWTHFSGLRASVRACRLPCGRWAAAC